MYLVDCHPRQISHPEQIQNAAVVEPSIMRDVVVGTVEDCTVLVAAICKMNLDLWHCWYFLVVVVEGTSNVVVVAVALLGKYRYWQIKTAAASDYLVVVEMFWVDWFDGIVAIAEWDTDP